MSLRVSLNRGNIETEVFDERELDAQYKKPLDEKQERKKLPELLSNRLEYLFIGMMAGAFTPVIIYRIFISSSSNAPPYLILISTVAMIVFGVIGYFRGRKKDKKGQ